MARREEIIEKIVALPNDSLVELEQFIDGLFLTHDNEIQKISSTERCLEKIKQKLKPESDDTIKLAENFQKEWDLIKEEQILTNYFIDIIRQIKSPQSEIFAAKRIKGDSRTGGFFEDNFGFVLNSYLMSKIDLWSEDNNFEMIKITLNHPIDVPGERIKKQPDILIRDYHTGTPICILELKASFTSRSLIKTYNNSFDMWKRLDEDIRYLFVMFSCSSKQKSQTYKKVKDCRIICYDFKTDKSSKIKGITPQVVDPIEGIFEEIYDIINDFRANNT